MKSNILRTQSSNKTTMKICIKDMEVFSYHGVYDFEKENGQIFLISIEISINYDISNDSDLLEQTIDYAKVYKRVYQISRENKFNLIESLAQQIALTILREFSEVLEVSVKVKKPRAPIEGDFKYVGSEIKLTR